MGFGLVSMVLLLFVGLLAVGLILALFVKLSKH